MAYLIIPPAALTLFHPLIKFGAILLVISCTASEPEHWLELFNGTNLTGWRGDPTVWQSQNGYISGKAAQVSQNTYLIYDQPFSDFILEAKVLIINAGPRPDSGIQYRSFVTNETTWQVGGYQADVGSNRWGELVDEEGRGILVEPILEVQNSAKNGEWNQYRITAQGSRLEHELNGIKSVVFEDKDVNKRHLSGLIALQYHEPGANFEIRYKDIRIKLLTR
jgi:Domain of Unknown Function (DUF1080)